MAVCAAGLLVVGVASACGDADEDEKPRVIAVAAGDTGPDPFFSGAIGRDRRGLTPGAEGGVRTGDTPGLYGGTLHQSSCDKAALTGFLTDTRNARKAAAWSKVRGIDVGHIRRYVRGLTPVLLRTDTLVRNHGFRRGAATVFESLLEAGVAVLLDRFGQPVVKCNCGNPLAPPALTPDAVDPDSLPDPEWRDRYDRRKTTTVKPGKKPGRIGRFRLLDLDTGKGIGRVAGADAARDVRLPAPPPLPPASAEADTPTPSSTPSGTLPGTTPPDATPPDATPSDTGPSGTTPSGTTPSGTASERPGIVGTWELTGARVRIEQRGTDAFVGRTASENQVGTGGCVVEEGREIWRVSGGGPRYTGTAVSLDPSTCQEAERVDATWELTGADALKVCLSVEGQSGCTTLSRVEDQAP
ncbi:DUF6777 domain-containing protein [Streptomyces sp. G45]|uniref:DUF6777 domain-containing protein n=1 Tax=Streptomyces sp. G45 TaxID=3406627 RepID=UPI003C1C938F